VPVLLKLKAKTSVVFGSYCGKLLDPTSQGAETIGGKNSSISFFNVDSKTPLVFFKKSTGV